MTRVVAVRHGETEWNRTERLQGWAPVPLNERGREQAAAAGEWLADAYSFDRVFVSDLTRTIETADIVLEAADGTPTSSAPVSHEPDWRERNLGVYQGLTYGEVDDRFPDYGLSERARRNPHTVPEGGESYADMADRVTRRFSEIVDDYRGETMLVVTHGGPLHLLLGHAKGMSIPEALTEHSQNNCAVNEFEVSDGRIDVVRENATDWL